MEAKALYRPLLNGQADGNPHSSQYAVYICKVYFWVNHSGLSPVECMNTCMHAYLRNKHKHIFRRDDERTAFDKFIKIAP
jgi:hypothetical protein